jgi:hypothetical protein
MKHITIVGSPWLRASVQRIKSRFALFGRSIEHRDLLPNAKWPDLCVKARGAGRIPSPGDSTKRGGLIVRHISRITWVVFGLATTLLASAGASTVMAATYVRALAAAYDQNTAFNTQDTGQIAGPLAFAQSGPFADYGGSFYAKAYAQFDPLLGPVVGAYSTVNNTYPLYQAFTPAEAWWSETFTVTGTPGTQVSFNLGFHLHDTLSGTNYPGFADNLGVQAVAYLNGTGAAAGLSIHDLLTSPAATKTVWHMATFNVGDVVTLGGDLYTDATAQGGTATADGYSTGLFALKIETPGAGYTTENGTVFATSFSVPVPGVPELGTWAMMIIGFGGVGLRLRRRRGTVALLMTVSPPGHEHYFGELA